MKKGRKEIKESSADALDSPHTVVQLGLAYPASRVASAVSRDPEHLATVGASCKFS
jgi:hypothetical protein